MSNVNNVKIQECQMSTMSNCQQCQIVRMSNCQNVKLSQYQMSCIIRVCRLIQRIDCVLIFSIFGTPPTLNTSEFTQSLTRLANCRGVESQSSYQDRMMISSADVYVCQCQQSVDCNFPLKRTNGAHPSAFQHCSGSSDLGGLVF